MLRKHLYFMSLVLQEAKKGIGFTSPYPMVGDVIVKGHKIISKEYHKKVDDVHAEVDAIRKVDKKYLKGTTLYVNLEPCCHYGRTPPCTNAVIESGIKRVVIANLDVDERVAGKGVDILKKAGIKVQIGILEEEAKALNSIYFFNKTNKRPYIVLKAAMILDGKIATNKNDSKWISSENCRYMVHKLRLRLKSIAVGKNTILNDEPRS